MLKKYDNILPLNKRQLVKYLKKVSRVLFNRITKEQWAQHEEADVSYADLKASIEGYYEENVDHQAQTDELEAVKDDPALNKKVIEATKAYIKNSTSLTELRTLVKSFYHGLIDILSLQRSVHPFKQCATTSTCYHCWANKCWGENVTQVTEEPPSRIEGETEDMETKSKEENPEEPKMALLMSSFKPPKETSSQQTVKLTDTILDIPSHKPGVPSTTLIVPVLVPYMINGKLFYLTEEKIQAHLDKEDQIKKAVEEARLFEMNKPEVIKVVREEAKNIGINPKIVISAQAGEKFKKAQDVEHEVLKREHTLMAQRVMELKKKRAEQYN
ncbi:hypothetical protein Tco_0599831 [Tanacetum coccineum]